MEELRDAERQQPEEAAPGTGADGSQPAAEAAADVAVLQARVAELEQALAEQQTVYQRLQADFANFRRRMFQEQREWEARGIARFVHDLLPVLDNLERAVAAAGEVTAPEAVALRQGVELTLRQLLDVLRSHGVEPVEAEGRPFDPRLHEAFEQVETDAVPEGHVVAELRRGFRLGERLIRPALVRVARPPRAAEAAGAGDGVPAADGAPAAGHGEPPTPDAEPRASDG